MRSSAAAGPVGCVHESGMYTSDEEFLAMIVPFAEDGVAAGDPVITGYDERKTALLRSSMSDPSGITAIDDRSLYGAPAHAIRAYQQIFDESLAAGAARIRIAGDVPHPGNGGSFRGWDDTRRPSTWCGRTTPCGACVCTTRG